MNLEVEEADLNQLVEMLENVVWKRKDLQFRELYNLFVSYRFFSNLFAKSRHLNTTQLSNAFFRSVLVVFLWFRINEYSITVESIIKMFEAECSCQKDTCVIKLVHDLLGVLKRPEEQVDLFARAIKSIDRVITVIPKDTIMLFEGDKWHVPIMGLFS